MNRLLENSNRPFTQKLNRFMRWPKRPRSEPVLSSRPDKHFPGRQNDYHTGVEHDLDALSQDMNVTHDLNVCGTCEWEIMRITAKSLLGSGCRLRSLSIAKFADDDVSNRLRISDLSPAQAHNITQLLGASVGVVHAKIEHMILRTPE